MADTKISGLSATTTLDAADEFPLNDSGTTKKITAANLAAQLAGMQPQDAGGGGSATNMTQGATGATGPAGGATGATGSSGVTGPAGLDGIDGAVGPPGGPGFTGATGAGVTGATGPVGLDGLEGPRGHTGPTGPPGVDGSDGNRGFTGPQGLDGLEGRPGATGTGTTGATGPQGSDGLDGMPGPTGATGTAGVGIHDAYALLRDEKATGTAGGTLTTGAWQTHALTTEKFDPGGIVTLTANQFDLASGTYLIKGWATAYHANLHQVRIRDVDNNVTAGVGGNARCMSTDENQDISVVTCQVVVSGTTTFELQQRSSRTQTTDGFGVANSFGEVEVYAEVEIWREA